MGIGLARSCWSTAVLWLLCCRAFWAGLHHPLQWHCLFGCHLVAPQLLHPREAATVSPGAMGGIFALGGVLISGFADALWE